MAGLWTLWLFGRVALAVFVSLENYATLLIDFLVVLQLILAKNPRSPPAHHFPNQVFCNLIIALFKIGLCSFLEHVRFHVTFLSCEFYIFPFFWKVMVTSPAANRDLIIV